MSATEQHGGQFDFAAFFTAKVKERGLTLKKLADLSGIALRDLENLSEGDFANLPPAPYLRGYTVKLSQILEFDPELWWNYFKEIGVVKRSGREDMLPENRFAISRTNRYGWIVLVGLVFFLYGAFRFSEIVGNPVLAIHYPAAEITRVEDPNLILRGTLERGASVFINGEPVPVGENKAWEKEIVLQPGLTNIEIRASKFLGRETRIIRQVVYEPPATVTSTEL